MANQSSFCHVFLSFKGETRDKFICFLQDALNAEGIVSFMDKSDIHVGDGVDLTIREGIRNSMSAIIIFSPNYAYSAWCLDELVLILERNKNSKYFIIPIFYEVEVRDIKHQLGNYGHALKQHRERHSDDKVDKWRGALVEVGDILGHHVEGPHNVFIRNIVKLFGEKLATTFPECRLPTRISSVLQGNSSSSLSSHRPAKSDIGVGDGVDLTIKEGIRNSMSAIIIFSPNYAYSAWCLDELVLILERNQNSEYFIIPVFYEVEVRDIKHQLGNYGHALKQHRARHNDKVKKWREALVEVGNILGHHVEGPHNAFIRNTVKLFGEKLVTKFPECRLPTPKSAVLQGSSSLSSRKPTKNKVILYTSSANDGNFGANSVARMYLTGGNVAFEERNCSKEPKYIRELEELLGNDRVRFPTLIVNGKVLCGEEEVEGLDDFMQKPTLVAMLNMYYTMQAI